MATRRLGKSCKHAHAGAARYEAKRAFIWMNDLHFGSAIAARPPGTGSYESGGDPARGGRSNGIGRPPDDQNSSRKMPRPDMISTISVQTTGLLSHCNTIATPLGIKVAVRQAAPYRQDRLRSTIV
jgi:hypothetical protein